MYRIRTRGYSKHNAEQRWALPDRVFFACGACHILAYAFLERYGFERGQPLWLKPAPGFTGNHIFIAMDDWVFDYHGYSRRDAFLAHSFRRARHWWPGWNATIVSLPPDVLISGPGSRSYEGLSLREPREFLHDAMPRARAFLKRFPSPDEAIGFHIDETTAAAKPGQSLFRPA
jgi:hypothetical protein